MAAASDHPNPNARSVEAKDEGLTFGTVLGATIGNMLEFYDFVTYSFFATQIGHTFFPSRSEFGSLMLSLATFGAGFVTRPIGAIVIGSYSDGAGRGVCNRLCGCDRDLRRHGAARRRLVDGAHGRRACALLVFVVGDRRRSRRHDIHAGDRALESRGPHKSLSLVSTSAQCPPPAAAPPFGFPVSRMKMPAIMSTKPTTAKVSLKPITSACCLTELPSATIAC
jgi:hypothetical protein